MADVRATRLDLAGTRGFATPGAGPVRRAALTDFGRGWLAERWAEATGGRHLPGVALAAVGSLARGDGGPLSDYDLVLVHQSRTLGGAELDALADRLWYPMWDAGVQIDHSVRTLAQCREVASRDLAAAVGLLDLAHVAGDEQVVSAARSTVAHDWRSAARRRLPEVAAAVSARHTRVGDAAHLLQPDLKEARGGLRDMTVLRALAAAWLTDRPHGEVDAAYARLLDVRDAIHVVTGRGRDRLTHDDRDAVAALLGYDDADRLLVDVSSAARIIGYAADGTLRRAGQSQRARVLRVGPRRPTLVPLGYGLFLHDGEAVLGAGVDPRSDPTLVLRAALIAARNGVPLAPATLANLAAHAAPLPQPWPADALALLGDLLAAGPGLVTVWEGLDLAGLVEQWIPEWREVRSRPQHNPVHRHTVDRHSIEAVVVASGLVREVARPDLLLLAALLHDIGKVAGAADHSEVGAPVADRVLARLGVEADDRAVVVRLVREHLTLVDLATRRDPGDPATLAAVHDAVGGSAETLELLRALTEADARAAGPAAWSDWRAQLVGRLADAARRSLQRAVGAVEASAAAEADPADRLDAATRATLERVSGGGLPEVSVTGAGAAYQLVVVAPDRLGLFADTAGLLAAHGLVVRSAVLRTLGGTAVDEWHCDAPSGDAPDPHALSRGLARLAVGDRQPLALLERRKRAGGLGTGLATSGRPGQTRAMVLPQASAIATVIEVRAGDRPGLLHDLGAALTGAGLSVRSAHIATYAAQALDTFYLTQPDGAVLTPAQVARVVALLIETADGRDGPVPS
ncbi:MAG TPA: [protein-PII] uridylyltransferase [Dermatophilaceae bacterium]|nr:[protein-PII] uridylyltransferase [Dermatophilaceae bacterium]